MMNEESQKRRGRPVKYPMPGGPEWPRFRNVISVASNGTPLTSYYHPYEIVPKDDVFVCNPPDDFPLPSIFYTITALNAITWRFSYYRKAYLNKLDKISIHMPIAAIGEITSYGSWRTPR